MTMLDMTPLGWLGRKTSTQTNTQRIQPGGFNFSLGEFQMQLHGMEDLKSHQVL